MSSMALGCQQAPNPLSFGFESEADGGANDGGRDAGPEDGGDAGPPTPDPCEPALGVPCDDFEQAYVKASNTRASARFGSAIAIDGDTIAVGAPNEASPGPGVDGDQNDTSFTSGAVYVFVRREGAWSQQAFIKAAVPKFGAQFGFSVSLDGDNLAIGAPRDDDAEIGEVAGRDVGTVYVFTRSSGVWTQQARLRSSTQTSFGRLGFAVAIDGDSLVAGAPGRDARAYVFTQTSSTWSETQILEGRDVVRSEARERFGSAVAMDGDLIAIGAPDDSGSTLDRDAEEGGLYASGAVHLFERVDGAWIRAALVKASSPGNLDRFGTSVALDGERLAVGAPYESSSATGVDGAQSDDSTSSSGAVYIFNRTGGAWPQAAYLKSSNTEVGDLFGWSLALDGHRLAVGAPRDDSSATGVVPGQDDDGAPQAGAVHLFGHGAGGWRHEAYIKASNTGTLDVFGRAVGLSGSTLVVGAEGEDSAATGIDGDERDDSAGESGAAYFRRIAP